MMKCHHQKIGVGVIGIGGVGTGACQAAASAPHMELVGVADSDDARRAKGSKEFGAKAYRDYRRLLDRKDIGPLARREIGLYD
jgi:predicted dehydrogenase